MAGDDKSQGPTATTISFGPFRIHVRERRLERGGQDVALGSRAMAILVVLAQRPGTVISHEELRKLVWPDTAMEESGLRVQVAALRRALGEYGPRYVTNVPGQGYCFVGPISQGASPTAVATSVEPHARIPAALDRILGRESEISELSRLVTTHRVVNVVATGGMGKSTVAIAVAHALSDRFDQVRYVDLSSLAHEEHVLPAVASAVGFSPTEPLDHLVAFLETRRLLLLLDSCEHVVEKIASLVRAIVAGTADVHLLATSRELLRTEGERVHRLAALACPSDAADVSFQQAMTFPAFQLFVERSTSAGASLGSSNEEGRVIARMCQQLDGIPLAIEVAAGKVEALGIQGTAALLDTRFTLLWRGRRTAVPRHQTLSAMVDWSYNLLTDVEKDVLRRMSILPGPSSIEVIHAVACDAAAASDATLDAIAALVEKSLVAVDPGSGAALYRLLDTTRAYAQRKLEPEEAQAAWKRLATELIDAAEDQTENGSAGGPGVRVANLRAALEWAFSSRGDRTLAVALAEVAGPLFIEQSFLRDAERWSQAALSSLAASDLGTRREMNLQATLGLSAFALSGAAGSHAALERALILAKQYGDGGIQMSVLAALSIFETRTARHRDALAIADEAEAVALRMQDPEARMLAEWIKGRSEHLLGNPARAERLCRTALATTALPRRLAGAQFGFDHRLSAVVTHARVLWLLGRADDARTTARRAIKEATATGEPVNVAMALGYTSTVFLWCGELDAARELVEQVSDYTCKHGPEFFHRLVIPGLRAELIVHGGATDVGVLNDAVNALTIDGHLLWYTAFATAIAEAVASLGRTEDALAVIDAAIASTASNGGSYDLPEMFRVKGRLLAMQPKPASDEAEQWILRALASAEQQGALAWNLRTATTLANLRVTQGRNEEAQELVASRLRRFHQGFDTRDLKAARQLLTAS